MSTYLCGLDIGGTFTDCVIVDDHGHVVSAKAPSTPGDFADGLMNALEAAARKCGQPVSALLSETALVSHGTTVGTNAIVQKRGARVGFVTTRGHNDVIHIMRGSRGLDGREVRQVVHIPESRKPTPIVPKRLIRGVSERVDCFGNVVVKLNEAQARQAIRELLAQDVDAIAICFLWSFLEPAHERRVKAMVQDLAPGLFVTCSHELVPKWGEYERTTASCLNAYVGPITTSYLADIEQRLAKAGYRAPLQITQSAGGTIPVDAARRSPLLTLDSGPVAGVMGSRHSAGAMGYENVITTDMGGTSFDIGVIHGGEPAYAFRSKVHQYEYYLPKVDIQAIGSGGGSMVRIDEITGTLQVGPESAGAEPGPVCYGRGGDVPTVTDADLVLGRLNPENFAGGSMRLDLPAARRAIATIAERLNMDVDACASGITQIVEFQMADLIHKATIQKGFDPRDFVVFAFGGAGPAHAGVFAAELGVSKVVIPQRATASVWCAFGAASADLLHIYERVDIMVSPFDLDRVNSLLDSLRVQAQSQLLADGMPEERHRFRYALDMRHKGQIHEVEVGLDEMPIGRHEFDRLHERFTSLYERLYGSGSSLAGARLEIVTARCRASAATPKPSFVKQDALTGEIPPHARLGRRSVYWPRIAGTPGGAATGLPERIETPIYDGHRLVPGNRLDGPAVVELETTTVVLHSGQTLQMDAYGNFELFPGTGRPRQRALAGVHRGQRMETSMLRISEMGDVRFDGKHYPYVPPEELRISRTLKLHRNWAEDVDPVTFEVIRHNLWHVNDEHGTTIQKVSGSPVAIYALDLNPSILTEDAEFVYFGPYMQYMSGVTDTQVKWILEHRSDNPGIRDGDMFLANDPWVGAAHQQDVMLICPVFWEGELFCWITNCLHQYDVGGITPSSFCPAAESAYDEGILIPPVKIVENNVIRRDIEELYLRASRKPEMVALDFRAQLAGNTTARARIFKLIERYGPSVVKGVMKRIIDNAEKAYLEKMARLPDGQWQERTYVESCRPGDRRTHRVMLTVRKEGTRLTFENHGSAPQDGAMNATYSGWRGSVMVAINELLCWDQYFAVGGALRHIDFNPTPGTFNCANFPASVSTAPIQAMEISLYPAYNAISKMIHTDSEMRGDILCIGGTSQWPCTVFRGIDQWGERYGYILVDPIGGAIGAFAHADGINTGGQVRTPICQLPNVEHTEQSFPVLFLYRKELPDSGGAGRFRGGMSAESCFIPHNTEVIVQDTLSSGNATPTSPGLMGGYPSTTNRYAYVTGSDIAARFARGEMPEDIAEVEGTPVHLELRQQNLSQRASDVYAVRWCGGGGFGDPMERDPQAIQADLDNFAITEAAARDLYAAVLDEESGCVDPQATARHRERLRAERLRRFGRPSTKRYGTLVHEVTPYLHAKRDERGVFWACARCITELGPIEDNYKLGCNREDRHISTSNPLIGEPRDFINDDVEFRQFSCPGCGTLIENEVAVASDPVLEDINLVCAVPAMETS